MKSERKSVIVDGKKVEYTFIDNDGDKVCFMFSGASYLYDNPLFYYSTMLMLEHKYDVVYIHFSYKDEELDLPMESMTNVIAKDVDGIMEEVLNIKSYEEKLLLGKSFGTIPIINAYMKDERFSNTKMVILTPLVKFDRIFNNLMDAEQAVYLVIGTDDPHYISDRINTLTEKENIVLEEFQGANHSLDKQPFKTIQSLELLKETLMGMQVFLEEKVLNH
ncbi:alpha/beta hydrolase [Pseudalkalibacillus sp. Hm43]|uniref:alpha/beta hydrolase n=1 Tax=Pseudalkalibacillus sp. Hm43 TaxID=3450742 RepID=UPI003F41E499